jgi:putative membrane protein
VAVPGRSDGEDTGADVTRRTWLAAERTWLAWWRTGVATAALAIGVGRLLPGVAGGAHWPLRLLGLGYGLLAVAVLLIGAWRQRRSANALRHGGFEPLSSPLVNWLTSVGVLLAIGTVATIAATV